VERHEYAEAAHLLEAVQQLSSHFQSYVHIPKVAELKGRLMTLEKSLQVCRGQGGRHLELGWAGSSAGEAVELWQGESRRMSLVLPIPSPRRLL